MHQKLLIPTVVCLFAAVSLMAQTPAPPPETSAVPLNAAQRAALAPTDSDMYCSGFFSPRPVDPSLFVLGSDDGGLKYEFGAGEIIYLSKGKGWVATPDVQYMLVRPLKDVDPKESFPGQHALLSQMGTLYAEIARIQVRIVHEGSAIAQIVRSCESALAGDIAIPLTARTTPSYKQPKISDRFAPSSGKPTGVIVAIKEFQQNAGTDNVVYLNVGKNKGAQVGGYLRMFRTYQSGSLAMIRNGTRNYLDDVMGITVGRKLSLDEAASLPRTVLGELMILSVEDESSTAIITYSWQDVYPGDEAEME